MTNTPNSGIERYITPEFWSTPGIDMASPEARLLYLAMHTWADDHGRGTRNPVDLTRHAFPRDPEITPRHTIQMLAQIRRVFPVTYYTVNGVDYYQIDNWKLTQGKPNTPPVYPSPDHPAATQIQ